MLSIACMRPNKCRSSVVFGIKFATKSSHHRLKESGAVDQPPPSCRQVTQASGATAPHIQSPSASLPSTATAPGQGSALWTVSHLTDSATGINERQGGFMPADTL